MQLISAFPGTNPAQAAEAMLIQRLATPQGSIGCLCSKLARSPSERSRRANSKLLPPPDVPDADFRPGTQFNSPTPAFCKKPALEVGKASHAEGGNEYNLQERPKWQRGGRPAADGQIPTRGAHVSREHCDQQEGKACRRSTCGHWHQQSDRTQNLQQSCRCHDKVWPWEGRRNHADEISAPLSPVRRRSEKKHCKQCAAQADNPALKDDDACCPDSPQGERQGN